MKKRNFFLALILLLISFNGVCQESIFMLLKNDVALADGYFESNSFSSALQLYLNAEKKSGSPKDISLKIARCYYFLKQYEKAAAVYERFKAGNDELPVTDLFYLAEAKAATGNYNKAIEYYKDYLSRNPGDELTIKKIWRLNNIQFLLEDSLHYSVRPISLNTEYGELCAVSFRGGIVFMSNREEVGLVDHINASINTPFYRLYYANAFNDTIMNRDLIYDKPEIFSNELNFKYHTGPVNFYKKSRMVFTASGSEASKAGKRTLKLFFAEEIEGVWKVTGSFPYNDMNYSISDPAISEDGKLLFFSSDMDGGFGGKDIYSSEFLNGKWTTPVNLGETINTTHDEVSPFLHNNNKTLYFSSNGHAGLGGLDIFKAEIKMDGFSEVQNLGYPLNSNSDDFGIVIDSLNTHGYLTSNRKNGGFNDDIYEFDMDIQSYPLEINGIIKYIEQNWVDSSELKILPNAKLYLIDNIKNITVAEGKSDNTGNFTIVVPYFSTYKIRVTGEKIEEGIVSFEVPKYRKENYKYEIVVVRDGFKSIQSPEER